MTFRKKAFVLVLFLCLLFPSVFAAEETDEVTMPVIYQEVFSSTDYLVTSGDVYVLSYNALGTAVNYTLVVDQTYKVKVSNLGIIEQNHIVSGNLNFIKTSINFYMF